MVVHRLDRQVWVPQSLPAVFDFFAQAENLSALTPPWLKFHILTPLPVKMEPGATIAYSLRVHGIPFRWLTRIERWNPPFEFVDLQVKGPYKLWRHTHRFSEQNHGTLIDDSVEFSLGFGPVGRFAYRWVSRDVKEIFDYREQQIHARFG